MLLSTEFNGRPTLFWGICYQQSSCNRILILKHIKCVFYGNVMYFKCYMHFLKCSVPSYID